MFISHHKLSKMLQCNEACSRTVLVKCLSSLFNHSKCFYTTTLTLSHTLIYLRSSLAGRPWMALLKCVSAQQLHLRDYYLWSVSEQWWTRLVNNIVILCKCNNHKCRFLNIDYIFEYFLTNFLTLRLSKCIKN